MTDVELDEVSQADSTLLPLGEFETIKANMAAMCQDLIDEVDATNWRRSGLDAAQAQMVMIRLGLIRDRWSDQLTDTTVPQPVPQPGGLKIPGPFRTS